MLIEMPHGGQCVFNSDWLVDDAYKDWLQGVKGNKRAVYCKLKIKWRMILAIMIAIFTIA